MPPPPPRPPLLEEELEELELEELLPEPGVGPEVTGMAQGVLPEFEGAVLAAELVPSTTSAVSIRPWLSLTVTRSVTDPEVGAMTVAEEEFAPTMAGGSVSGDTTVQA